MIAERPPFTEFVLKGTSRCDLQPRFNEKGEFVGGCDYIPESLGALTNVHGCYEYANDMWMGLPKWMNPDVTKQAALRIGEHAKRHSLPHVRVIGHGGELLMATPQWLDQFSTIIESEIAGQSPDTKLQFFVTTNGRHLNQAKLDVLKKHGYKVGLSLDGDREANDRHRRDRHGESTYDSVVAAARLLRENDANWGILAVIDTRNKPRTVLNSLASHMPKSISLLLPHANHSVQPADDPEAYGHWLNEAFDWYLEQDKENFILIPEFHSLMKVLRGGSSNREGVAGRMSQELFILPNGKYQRVDTIKSTEPGAVMTDMDIFSDAIDYVAEFDPGILARRMGSKALAGDCISCPLVKACGGGYYPHRFMALDFRLASNTTSQYFEQAFRNPTVYCEAQKLHIRHVADRLEQATGAPAGTLLRPTRQPVETPVPCPDGYEITRAMVGDEVGMVAVHAAAFKRALSNPAVGADPEAAQAFLYDDSPNGFYARKLKLWSSLTGGRQPDKEAQHNVLVARNKASGAIVGFGAGRIPHIQLFSNAPPMDKPSDEVVALYVTDSGKGIGSALLSGIMHLMGPSVRLMTTYNTDAVEYYQRHGFQPRPQWQPNAIAYPALRYGLVLRQLPMGCDSNQYRISAIGREMLTVV